MFSQQNLFSTTSPEDLTTTDWLIRMFCEEERIYSSGWVANSRLLLIGFLEKISLLLLLRELRASLLLELASKKNWQFVSLLAPRNGKEHSTSDLEQTTTGVMRPARNFESIA